MKQGGNTKVWDRIMRSMKEVTGPHVKVGVFGGESTKAAAHEFGTSTIPERSFIRSTFENHRPELVKVTGAVSRQIIFGTKVEKALGLLGQWAAAKVKNTIAVEGPLPEWEELSEPYATLKEERGKSKVLVDTGAMLNAITYKVEA